MQQPILIQEVSYKGSVAEGNDEPQYKVDNFVNICLIERVRPTKNQEVMAVTVTGKVSYVLRKDIEQYLPDEQDTPVTI
jgi:hypothetical protein